MLDLNNSHIQRRIVLDRVIGYITGVMENWETLRIQFDTAVGDACYCYRIDLTPAEREYVEEAVGSIDDDDSKQIPQQGSEITSLSIATN